MMCCGADLDRLQRPIVVDSFVSQDYLALDCTAMYLDSKTGVPARTSTSRFSTTRPSKVNLSSSRVNDKRVSPTTCGGDEPSAWWTDKGLNVT